MSTHLLIAAAYLEDLPQGTKLVLMAIADSGDEHTLESAPGLPKLRAWSGLGKSQALRVVAQLVEAGYVKRVHGGRVGRRAVFRVFPQGVPPIPHPSEVAARFADEDPAGSHPCDPLDVSTVGDNVGDGQESRVAPTRPSQNRGSHETPERVAPMRPLHASTSVSSARDATGQASQARPPSGFPGSRASYDEERGIARRARGAHNVPCPLHPAEVVPCGRCAHKAATDREDPQTAAQIAERKRAARTAARTTTATEETTP